MALWRRREDMVQCLRLSSESAAHVHRKAVNRAGEYPWAPTDPSAMGPLDVPCGCCQAPAGPVQGQRNSTAMRWGTRNRRSLSTRFRKNREGGLAKAKRCCFERFHPQLAPVLAGGAVHGGLSNHQAPLLRYLTSPPLVPVCLSSQPHIYTL